MRTSQTHPLQIAEVRAQPGYGLIGLTLASGKKQPRAASGAWDRDLDLDLDTIVAWDAAIVVTLLEEHELQRLQICELGTAVQRRHMVWHHLPLRDGGVPDALFEAAWTNVGAGLRSCLCDGFNVLVPCKGGLGRAGTIAARQLVELGIEPQAAIKAVREARPGAIETAAQYHHVSGLSEAVELRAETCRPGSRRGRAARSCGGRCCRHYRRVQGEGHLSPDHGYGRGRAVSAQCRRVDR